MAVQQHIPILCILCWPRIENITIIIIIIHSDTHIYIYACTCNLLLTTITCHTSCRSRSLGTINTLASCLCRVLLLLLFGGLAMASNAASTC